MKTTTDKYGRKWQLAPRELCSKCGQPDSLGECNHKKLLAEEVVELGGEPRHDELYQFEVTFEATTKRIVWAANDDHAMDLGEQLEYEIYEDEVTWSVKDAVLVPRKSKSRKKRLPKKRK